MTALATEAEEALFALQDLARGIYPSVLTDQGVCESIEAIHVLDGERLQLGCDNNFPNKGRNPELADDNEFIVVKAPGLKARHATGGTGGGI